MLVELSDLSRKSLDNLLGSLIQTTEAVAYLRGRGFTRQAVDMFRLGVVPTGATAEWAQYEGMLAIPYLTVSGPVAVKFRRLDGGEPKYTGPKGQGTRLFNATAVLDPGPQLVVVEGELDAITLHGECGVPAVGVPGAQNWRPHYRRVVDSFGDVVILTDNDNKRPGDNPGLDLALQIRESVRNSRIVGLPPGHDVNSFFVAYGRDSLLGLLKTPGI